MLSILFLAAVVLGGAGNLPGVIVGARLRRLPARAVPRLRRATGGAVFGVAPDRHDDLPAAGPHPEPAAARASSSSRTARGADGGAVERREA